MNESSRRHFLAQAAGAAVGVGFFSAMSSASANRPSVIFPVQPRERVAVASYPFREFIAGKDHKNGNPTIELKEFAAHVVEKFKVRKIEPWTGHFPSTEPRYLSDFRAAVEKSNAQVVNLAADGEHCPYAADREQRAGAVSFSKQWIDVAEAIGSPSIRTNIPPSTDVKLNLARLADSLHRVADHAAAKNIVVHLENDNPVSEDPFLLAEVIDRVNHPWLRALPDFGNTLNAHPHDENYAYRGIEAMFSHAYGICHVKDGEVDAEGKSTQVDLPRTFGILKRHAYRGFCSIEYDAPGDPYQPTAELIEKTVKYLGS